MTTRREFLRGGLRVAGGLALAACAPAAPTTPAASASGSPAAVKSGGTLIIGIARDPRTFDPAFTGGPEGRRLVRSMMDSLADLDADSKPYPQLAERWETPDPRTVIFRLRPGIKFHDGTDFDAEAVKYNFDRNLDSAVRSARRGELLAVDGVDIVDKLTAKVRLKNPSSSFISLLFDRPGFMLSPTAAKKWGTNDFGAHPVGAGPFRFVSYEKDVQTVVERNPDYWDKGRPYVDRIIFRVIPNEETRLTELRTGGIQIAEDLPFQDVARAPSLPELILSERKGFQYFFLRWNADNKPYGINQLFRQAWNWALDRDSLTKPVFFGTGSAAYSPLYPGTPFYDPGYKPFARDVAKAKALLDRSGLPSPARIVMTHEPVDYYRSLLQIFQQQLADVGIELVLQQESAAGITARTDSGDYVLQVTWWGFRPDPALYIGTLHHSKSTYFKTGVYKDAQLDALIEQGESEASLDKRRDIYQRITERINDGASYLFFYYGSDLKGLRKDVKGYQAMPDAIIRFKEISL